MQKKTSIVLILCIIFSSLFTGNVFALQKTTNLKVYCDGVELLDSESIKIKNGRTFYPVKELVESLGGNYLWNQKTKKVTITLNSNVVEFTVGSKGYKNNIRLMSMDSEPFIENEVIYAPIRFISEGLGYYVDWDSMTNSVKLTLKPSLKVDKKSLDTFLKTYGDTVSVYYENLETGYSYGYNADKLYFGASVIKAPYLLYVYQLAEQGKTDFSKTFTYTSSDYRKGTGVIKNMKVGTKISEKDLLKYAIRNSDNIALRVLIDTYGRESFKEYVTNIGGVASNIGTVSGANMTALEAGLYAREIYNYIEGGNKYSQQFKTDLMSTTNPMITSDFPIARKYGWATKSFHDMAIVYSESPYILVIMSARDGGTNADFKAFKDISMEIQTFNETNFN